MTLEKAEPRASTLVFLILLQFGVCVWSFNFEGNVLSSAFFCSVDMNHPASEQPVAGTGNQNTVTLLPNLSPEENENEREIKCFARRHRAWKHRQSSALAETKSSCPVKGQET